MNVLTGKLEKREIIKRSENPTEQYWERTPIPDWYKKKEVDELAKQQADPEYTDSECDKYREQEWDRRLNGCWFMNKGNPVFLSGIHYMYIQWWCIDIGYPKYRLPDLEYFYFLQYCIEDPECMGMIEITKRRFGKTYRCGLFLYEYTSRMEESQSGLQSKTNTDGKKVFGKSVIKPFKKLPKFFRPEYDRSQGITPKTELRFQQTNVKGRKAEEVLDKEELASVIDFQSSETLAYDGQKLHRYVRDEFAKTMEVDVYDGHDVVRYCLLDDEGRIIGKALYTSTVEEMDSGGEPAKRLWDDSDQLNKKENGRTPSGLYRFFMPAFKTRYIDKYGFPDEDKTREDILSDRKSIEHNARALSARIRKEPLTIEEAFRVDGSKCLYNPEKLNDQRDLLSWNENATERGNLEWENGIRDTKVIWVKNKNGRWEMPRAFMPKAETFNKVKKQGNLFTPNNNIQFGSSCDPFDHNTTEDNRRSNAASLVKMKNNTNDYSDFFIGTYVSKYKARPATAALMYEDMIKQCFYFGCSILAESNKPGILNYFRDRGYGAFLMHLPGYKEPGIPSTPENKQTASELVEAMIEMNCEKVFFIDLIEDWLEFDIAKTQKYDLAMASLWCEIACANKLYRQEQSKVVEIDTLFKRYKIG